MNYNSLKELFIAICDAIRNKEGSADPINHQDIPDRIRTLVTSATSIFQRNKIIQPLEAEQTIYPDDGYGGLSSVTVEAIPATYIGSAVTKKSEDSYTPGISDQYILADQYLTGVQTIKGDSDLVASNIKSGVTIFNVEGSYVGGSEFNLEEPNAITPTKSTQEITPSSGYDGLSKVTVNPIPDVYVNTSSGDATSSHILNGKKAWVDGEEITGNIPTKSSSDLSVSGATVTVPAGYYESSINKSVNTATQATPTITIDENGLITASVTQSAGYVSSGTKSDTEQLTTQSAKTITPGSSSQTAVAKGVYTTGAITVTGDSDLVASNIKSGVSIFNVSGTYKGEDPALQTKTVTPTKSTQTVTYDSNYDGLDTVTVNAIPSDYVDKNSLNYIDTTSNYGIDSIEEDGSYIQMVFSPTVEYVVGGDYPLTLIVHKSEFGDAKASDVASGKYFTSSEGLYIQGTATIGGGDYSSGDIVQSATSVSDNFNFISGYSYISVRYCNKSDLSASNSSVIMNNYSTVKITSVSDCSVLKGKCVQAEITSSGTYSDVYFIPTNASFSVSTSNGYLHTSYKYPMFVIA